MKFTEEQEKNFSIRDWYDLGGQVAVVTGGATGLGLAITRCLVSAGATVCAIGSRPEVDVHSDLAPLGDAVHYYRFDITETEKTENLIGEIHARFGRIDILVNNAGNHCKKFIWDMSVEDYKGVLDVHLVGAFALTKAVVPFMKEQGRGRILFQASMTSYIGQPMVAGYSTAKAGILGLIHTLTAELAEYGITVNAIAPGWIDTPMYHKAVDNDPPRLAKILGRIPAKSVGDPMDIGMVAAFLCSDAARYISGSCIPVDGGALIGF
ncbi:MAG: SDR family oxidoreductase [Lachnospiraceae bacterium]|nr:SDR family oxidoreductase [Lachnospiraceae bacterium]